MKRRLALLPLLLAALPACAGGFVPPSDGPDADEVVYESSVPLRARLVDAAGGLGIQVNRPAHVAVFEVVPGRGLGLMYPAYSSDRSHVSAGFSRVPRNSLRPYTWHYASGAGLSNTGPRYYLLVASRAPLRVERFQDDASAMRQWFGLRRFAALNPRPAMDELVQTVVPPQADEDWDTDLLTLWPQDSRDLFDDDRLVRVVCRNGYVVTTTLESVGVACGLFNNTPGEQAPPPAPDTLAPPSDSVQVPTRRRPEPRSADDAGEVRAERPDAPARVERWRATDDDADGVARLRPRARPTEEGDETGTPVVRRVPPRVETDDEPSARERDGGRVEAPRRRPGWVERSDRGSHSPARPEGSRSGPRGEAPREPTRETPRSETPRRESPREAPARPAPSRPEPRPESSGSTSSGASSRPAPASAPREGGDPR